MGSGSLGHILLGTGLGILAVSGLIVTVLFGQYHNKAFDELTLYYSDKIYWPKSGGLRSCCVAIAVLGCISAVAAIGAIVLSILLEGQTMVLIIVGAISALFAFACIIAEGVYTKKVIDFEKENSYSSQEHDHKKAQEYITNSINSLLSYGEERLKQLPLEEGEEELDLLPTKDVLEHLGQPFYKETQGYYNPIFTYQNYLWCPDLYSCNQRNDYGPELFTEKDYVVLYDRYDIIFATTLSQINGNVEPEKAVPVASYMFKPEDKKFVPKQKVCWPTNKNMSTYEDVECKMIKLKEINLNTSIFSSPSMVEEYIVPNEKFYYSKQDADDKEVSVSYKVSGFPAMYHKISKGDCEKEDFDFSYTDSDNSFDGLSGKKFAKLSQEQKVDQFKKGDEEKVFVTLNKVSDYNSLISECKKYYEKCNEKNEEGCQKRICEDDDWDSYLEPYEFEELMDQLLKRGYFYNIGYDLDVIMEDIQERYPDNNKGKLAPAYKEYLKEDSDKEVKDLPKSSKFYQYLYTVALIHLIVQIFGIILWAVGRFVGLALGGGSDAKTQSEGEA